MKDDGKCDEFFLVIRDQIRNMNKAKSRMAFRMAECRECRRAGAWEATWSGESTAWEPTVAYLSSYGSAECGYILLTNSLSQAVGAYALHRPEWGRVLELLTVIFSERWQCFLPYGSCRTIFFHPMRHAWASYDGGQKITMLPNILSTDKMQS